MRDIFTYTFKYVHQCIMCGAPSEQNKILGKRLNQSQGFNPSNKIGITTTIVKCSRCNLVYSNPQPIPSSLDDHYEIPPESYWVDEYFKENSEYFKAEIATAQKLLNNPVSPKSLDIGAGIGKCMKALANAGFDSYGFEPSRPFYEKAIGKMGISTHKLKLCSIEEAQYQENTFDFITFGAVLEHLYDPSESILKALSWLKKGGIIHIEVPSSNWLINRLINYSYSIRFKDFVGNLSPMHEPFHLYEFGLKSFEHHAKKYNYQLIRHEYYVCQTFMPKIIDWIIRPYMQITKQGMQLCVWLKK